MDNSKFELKNRGFDSVVVLPKDMEFHDESMFYGLHVNAGHVSSVGDVTVVERRSMGKLLQTMQHLRKIPGYLWCVGHMRITAVAKAHQLDREALAKSGPVLIRKLMDVVKKTVPMANIFYRWHLEWSEDAGYHYHVAVFFGSSHLQGIDAFMASFHKVKLANQEYAFATAEFAPPNFDKVKKSDVRDYFVSKGLVIDRSKKYLRLSNDIDWEYALYWLSYMCKLHTKEQIIEEGLNISGGSYLLPRKVKTCKPRKPRVRKNTHRAGTKAPDIA